MTERVQDTFPTAVLRTQEICGELQIILAAEQIEAVAQFLRDDPALEYVFLEQLCGVDYLGRDPRFEVVYHLFSLEHCHRICLKVGVSEAHPHVPTLTTLWPTANWQERETFDMFGIIFDGHPRLDRILLPDDWIGYPQRKDVPIGEEEVAFTFNQDRIYAQKPFAKE